VHWRFHEKAVHEAHVAAEVFAGELQGNKELVVASFNAPVYIKRYLFPAFRKSASIYRPGLPL
jgi:hypothetical protein